MTELEKLKEQADLSADIEAGALKFFHEYSATHIGDIGHQKEVNRLIAGMLDINPAQVDCAIVFVKVSELDAPGSKKGKYKFVGGYIGHPAELDYLEMLISARLSQLRYKMAKAVEETKQKENQNGEETDKTTID
jgi:hypothetical protein